MSDSKLLKDAIADAKAVRETALSNAKAALEEAFTPRLQSMLADKLQQESTDLGKTKNEDDEDEDEDDKDDDDEFINKKDKVEEKKHGKKKYEDKDEDEDEDKEDYDDDDDMEEDLDLESVIKELEDDLAETAGTDQDPDDDDDANDTKTITKKKVKEETDELDIDALIKEIEEEEDEIQDSTISKEVKNSQTITTLKETIVSRDNELSEYKQAIIFLREKINEINLLNAKLLYANKLFRAYEMTNDDKVKVIESIDRSVTPREVKLVYATLAESMRMHTSSGKTVKRITEGASAAMTSTKPDEKTVNSSAITEVIDPARWKELANIS